MPGKERSDSKDSCEEKRLKGFVIVDKLLRNRSNVLTAEKICAAIETGLCHPILQLQSKK
jgi:hypothetical protein